MIRQLLDQASRFCRFRALGQPRRGQATIMFALLAIPMIGMLGLAVDGGVYFYARRTVQAAADAAALAGARELSKSTPASPKPAQTAVAEVTAVNGQGSVIPSVLECRYVDKNGAGIGSTCGPPPPNASGVYVKTTATVPTFFISVLPGGPSTSTTTGEAAAMVQRAVGIPADAPFIVCGMDAITSSGPIDIIGSSDPFTINPAAVGQTFNIHGPHVASCGLEMEGFKGLLSHREKDGNADRPVPGPLVYETGDRAGPTGQRVDGPGGCASNTEPPYTCVMLLPIATDSPPPDKKSSTFYAVGFAAFEVTSDGSNAHKAKLLGSYIIPGQGQDGWKHGDGGVVTVRITR